jgi:hypothetical protein
VRHNKTITLALLSALPLPGVCQITAEQQNALRTAIGSRIEALQILGGDYGLSGGQFRSTGKFVPTSNADADLHFSKLGGSGDFGSPKPLGGLDVGWQLHLQGNMGKFKATNRLHVPGLEGDLSSISGYALEFGGGARFWVSDRVSIAPLVMALYGQTTQTYTPSGVTTGSNPAQTVPPNLASLVNWKVDTLTGVASIDVQYEFLWHRAILTFSGNPTFYDTRTLHTTNHQIGANGNSSSMETKFELDVPIGLQLFDHELRTGGYLSHTDLFGGLKDGLGVSSINEVHGRITLDFMQQLRHVRWLGVGASYLWGPGLKGWTAGADLSFWF